MLLQRESSVVRTVQLNTLRPKPIRWTGVAPADAHEEAVDHHVPVDVQRVVVVAHSAHPAACRPARLAVEDGEPVAVAPAALQTSRSLGTEHARSLTTGVRLHLIVIVAGLAGLSVTFRAVRNNLAVAESIYAVLAHANALARLALAIDHLGPEGARLAGEPVVPTLSAVIEHDFAHDVRAVEAAVSVRAGNAFREVRIVSLVS